jgi:hypothetical protein
MIHIDLTFVPRLQLTNLLSQQQGTLGKTAPFMRVLEKIRFTDEEDRQIVKTPANEKVMNYAAPNPEFGKLAVDIENADAAAVAALMEEWAHFTTADHVWAGPILKALKQ